MLKSWEWPGDEASLIGVLQLLHHLQCIPCSKVHVILPRKPFLSITVYVDVRQIIASAFAEEVEHDHMCSKVGSGSQKSHSKKA